MSLNVIFTDTNLILNESYNKDIQVHLEIPFSAIKRVMIRNQGESILVSEEVAPKTTGRFLLNKQWCFAFHHESKESILVLELVEQEYWLIAFQVLNPEEIKQRIIERMYPYQKDHG
jgi:predicted nucleotidyltransferase